MINEHQIILGDKHAESRENTLAFSLFAVSVLSLFLIIIFGSMRDVVLRFVHDDAFYYIRIADNLNRLHFSTFDGINPTNGYHPLLQWLLIIPSGWFSDMELFMRVLAAFGVALVFFAGVFVRWTLKENHNQAASLVWYWLAGSLVFATIYGLESPLAVFILAGLIYSLPRIHSHLNLKRAVLCGLLSGLLFLSRLDTLVWVGALDLIIMGLFIRFKDNRAELWRPCLVFILFQLAIVSAYFVYNVTVWGHWLTVSAMVKAGRSSLFSLAIPQSMLFFLAIFITIIGLVILVNFLIIYLRNNHSTLILKMAIPSWLCLSNLLYMAIVAAKGSAETYNWYFVPVVFSGAIILPYFVENYDISKLKISRHLVFRLTVVFCLALLAVTIHGKISQPSSFVGAYDRALDLAKLPEKSIIFASGDCGILGTISRQRCLNMDGLTNSFEFQRALRDDRLAEWLRSTGLNAYFTVKGGDVITTATLQALSGIDGVGRKVQVRLVPWPTPEADTLRVIRLYKIKRIDPL